MATKLENLELEIKHFKNIYQHFPKNEVLCENTIEYLLNLGVVQVSTMFEQCIARINGSTVISLDHADISDGSDAKVITVRTSSRGTSYSAPVSNIYNKTGSLRIQCYERKQDKFYYFVIPNHAYTHIPKSSNIEIPFYMCGTPKRVNNCAVNWWNYTCDSFEEMCTKVY